MVVVHLNAELDAAAAQQDDIIEQAARYYMLAIVNFLGDGTERLVSLNAIAEGLLDRMGLTPSTVRGRNAATMTSIAVEYLRQVGAVEVIDDRYAPPFVGSNDLTFHLSGHDPLYAEVEQKYAKLETAGTSWLTTAMAEIAFRFKEEALTHYLRTMNLTQLEKKSADLETGLPLASANTPSAAAAEEAEWEPLPVNRSNPTYIEAVSAAEAAIREVEGSNGYAATEAEERNGIVHVMKGTLQAIKEGTPSRTAVVSGLLKPLQYIVKKFGDTTMGEIAKLAVTKIIAWLFT